MCVCAFQQNGHFGSIILLISCLSRSVPSHSGVHVVIFFFISSFQGRRFLSSKLPLCFHLRLHLGKSIPHYVSKWNEPITFLAFFSIPPPLYTQFISSHIDEMGVAFIHLYCKSAEVEELFEFIHNASTGWYEAFLKEFCVQAAHYDWYWHLLLDGDL